MSLGVEAELQNFHLASSHYRSLLLPYVACVFVERLTCDANILCLHTIAILAAFADFICNKTQLL